MPPRPLLVVPGLFSSEIYDDKLGFIWGRLRQLYVGPPLATLDGVRGRPLGILRGIPLAFGLTYDLLGALEGALVQGGGYRIGETLHYFVYDWRLRVLDLGVELAAEIRRLAEAAGSDIDVLGLSNGGPVIRAAFAADRSLPVQRVVTSGGAHAGALETLACLNAGFQFAPLGRRVPPEQFAACPGGLDSIPPPAAALFWPEDEGLDLYDVETWRRLRLSVFRRHPDDPTWTRVLADRLAGVRNSVRDAGRRRGPPPADLHLRHRPAHSGACRRPERTRRAARRGAHEPSCRRRRWTRTATAPSPSRPPATGRVRIPRSCASA